MMELTEAEYRTLVEQAPIMIWRSDTTKMCDYFNDRWLEFTGRTLDQEVGNGWAEGVHPDDFDRCLAIYTTAFDKREVFEMYYRLCRHDGEYRWIFDRGVPFFDNGEFRGYIGSCIDVHEKVMSEKELEELNKKRIERLEAILPLCAWCKKIRTEDKSWISIGKYFDENMGSSVSHHICEDCMKSQQSGQKSKNAKMM